MVECLFTGGSLQTMASTLLEGFNRHNIDLYKGGTLFTDLRRLRIIERIYGFRLQSPRDAGGHGDKATAFTLAFLGCKHNVRNLNRTIELTDMSHLYAIWDTTSN